MRAAGRKDLAPEPEAGDGHEGNRDDRVDTNEEAAQRRQSLESGRQAIPHAIDPILGLRTARRRVALPFEQPDRQHRHQRAREQEGRNHREADGEREWDEERLRDARHEKGRDEHRHDRQHRQESGHHHFTARIKNASRNRRSPAEMRMDVFDRDGALVDQNPDREREAAKRHDVDGLPGAPQRDNRGQQRKRDRQHHDQRAAPVAQEQQHHEAREQGSENRLPQHGLQCSGDVPRLVELVAHLDVVGHQRPEPFKIRLHLAHNRQRRSTGTFRDGNVDRSSSVHQGIRRGNVRAVADGAEVAHENRGPRTGANRQFQKIVDVRDHRVHGRDSREVSDVHAAGGHDHVAGADGANHFLGRHPVRPQAIRIDANDDRALAASEWRR